MKMAKKVQRGKLIHIQGDISQTNAVQIESHLLGLLKSGDCDCLWLNMSQVNFIDSAGLGTLATTYCLSKNQNCNLVLCQVKPLVRLVLEITGLDQVLEFSDEVA